MVSRMHFEDEDEAVKAAEAIDAAGHEVALIKERFAGEDDDEAIDFVVATPAEPDVLRPVVGEDTFIETD
ncbi:hypothetical protein EDD41_3314 [Luteococcus japonicus]|nr:MULTISPECIES: hypothetical protein [Luteococcus]MDN5562958.1 hypothetical protein [Luteococcus sp.]ROR56018.1 hypothetical protein EDD41_3314 [Luteococcus japonicus]